MLRTPDQFTPLMVSAPHTDPLVFIFREGQLLVREHDSVLTGVAADMIPDASMRPLHPVGLWHGRYCCTTWVTADVVPPPGYRFVHLRALFGSFDEQLLGLASRASQLAEWVRTHRFCGHCATATQFVHGERAAKCPACGMTAYPRISPAMMVLIKKEDSILLARHTLSPTGRFSPLAGFLEAGESIEEAVHREVFEEVGLKVGNLQYFGSQSWPFPHSLMIAFTADYAGGDIVVDQNEIAEARWFGPHDAQPEPPSGVSISSLLVSENWPGLRGGGSA